ncbi:MAG: hypothetical protein ACRCT8_06220 [Lacipirellulaceae bacterium]
MTTINAHFDGQHFVPDEPVVGLRPGDRVEVALARPLGPAIQPSAAIQQGAATADESAWRERLQQAIDLHSVVATAVDDRRESIYAGRGE